MIHLFDEVAYECSQKVTNGYSTSFSSAVRMLAPSIRPAIHSIYGFVRFADEVVDTFHDKDKKLLLDKFEWDLYQSLEMGISLNPILHAFQKTIKEYNIDIDLVDAFLKSMRMDIEKKEYKTQKEYQDYIYGSADVVGLMCLKIFVNGSNEEYEKLKPTAMKLGSAFQKVNFLRDIKNDSEILERSYFPGVDLKNLSPDVKMKIVSEIKADFDAAYEGIKQLPTSSKFGVYTAFRYYKQLLKKLQKTPSNKLMETRIRVSDYHKFGLLLQSYLNIKLNIV
ncbi:MAG: phytoene synthase [Flavobacteriales bacterium]|nr:phytoene synthase [Flavobacteriales bacterium]|tara:strand:+ start:669 stop:1508 length:840 start_codon:yes stop_codon:yes gene_type:complete